MEHLLFSLTRALHIAAGGTALVSLFIPILAGKGGLWHRRGGWIYTYAMAVVAVSGAALSAFAITHSRIPSGVFLLFVALLSATNTWLGVRGLERKPSHLGHAIDLSFPVALALASIALFAYGVSQGSTLFIGFAVLGAVLGVGQIRVWKGWATRNGGAPAVTTRQMRAARHVTGMGGSCIATITAFLVVNANHLGFHGSILPWFFPAIVGTGLITWARRHYDKKRAAAI